MYNFQIGKKVYVADATHPLPGKIGEVTNQFSNGTHVNVFFVGVEGVSVGDNLRYFRKDQLALIPDIGDRVRLKATPAIHGTVMALGHEGLNSQVHWDRFQDYVFAGQATWGYSPDFLEPADEAPLAVGDRVRLTYAAGSTVMNGSTGKVSEINLPGDGRGIGILWDDADHVHRLLRGGMTWEAPTSLTKIDAEPAVETPTPTITASAIDSVDDDATIRKQFNEQVWELDEQSLTVDPFWRAAAQALSQVAGKRTYFTTDDIWANLKRSAPEGFIIDPRAMGALMVQAEKLGLVKPTKRSKPSKRRECHRRPIRVWKVTATGKLGAAVLSQPQP